EVIKLSGYLLDEKLAIARGHVVPHQLEAHGLSEDQLTISEAALEAIMERYARDPGVRTLEKLIKRIVRKSAVRLLQGEAERVSVGPGDLRALLGPELFRDDTPYTKP